MNQQQAVSQLDLLIRARTPVIGIETFEPHRVVEAVTGIIQDHRKKKYRNKNLFVWTVSRGISEVCTEDGPNLFTETEVQQASSDPEGEAFSIFQNVIGLTDDQDTEGGPYSVWILKDVHRYLENPAVLRSLRDAAEMLIFRNQTIILVSPALSIPSDAVKDVKVIAWPLPTKVELEEKIDIFVENMAADLDDADQWINGDKQRLVESLTGLNTTQADMALAQSLIKFGKLDVRAVQFCLDVKKDIVAQSGALEYYQQDVSYADVGGLDLLKAWLHEAGVAMTPEAAEFGISAPRGVVTAGVPGCGKSLTAKMVSGMWGVPLIRFDIGALFGSLLGETESRTRDALRTISAIGKCVVWMDEIEKSLSAGGGELDGNTSGRMFGTLLTAMEEQLSESGAFIFATANQPWLLKPELIRRFSQVYFVDLPGSDDRRDILKIHIRKTGRDPEGFELSKVVELSESFTGSELEQVVQSALWIAYNDPDRVLKVEHMEDAARSIVPLSKSMSDQIDEMRGWAERARPASSHQETGRISPTPGSGRVRRLEH